MILLHFWLKQCSQNSLFSVDWLVYQLPNDYSCNHSVVKVIASLKSTEFLFIVHLDFEFLWIKGNHVNFVWIFCIIWINSGDLAHLHFLPLWFWYFLQDLKATLSQGKFYFKVFQIKKTKIKQKSEEESSPKKPVFDLGLILRHVWKKYLTDGGGRRSTRRRAKQAQGGDANSAQKGQTSGI